MHFSLNINIPDHAFEAAGELIGDLNLEPGNTLGIAADVEPLA